MLTKEEKLAYLMLLPAFVLLFSLVGYPLFYSFYLSLVKKQAGQPVSAFVGLVNYINLFKSDTFRLTLQNSLIYTFVAVPVKAALGLVLAVLLSKITTGRRLFRGIILLPWVAPISISTLAWWWMFDPLYSVINWTLMKMGVLKWGIPWLGNTFWARVALITVNVWRGLPFFAVTFLAGLLAIPKDLHESAEIDGAGGFARFFHITLPLLTPLLGVIVLYSIVMTVGDFEIIYVLTKGGPMNTTHVFATLAFQEGIATADIARAATIVLFIFPFLAISSFFQLRIIRKRVGAI
ncbi:sugar ABC transporter permease [Candidatus Aerophobetes bacterium]|nr:sugar ABC transporter permease [Candidatus Aerophobetes bacterium]